MDLCHENSVPDIGSLFQACVVSFKELFEILNEGDSESAKDYVKSLREESSRFRIWVENMGVHRTGKISLDYRLREASKIKKMVSDLLKDLDKDLQKGIPSVAGIKLRKITLKPGETTSKQKPMAEPINKLEECLGDIAHVITCLYDFSIAIQNPAPKDRLQKCADIAVSHFEEWDIMHESNTFQGAPDYLLNRLGKSNTKRRQLLKYHKRHQDIITGRQGFSMEDTHPARIADVDQNQLDAPAITEEPQLAGTPKGPDLIDGDSETGQSMTSFASSAIGAHHLSIPPPPDPSAFEGRPFRCNYCYSMVKIKSRKAWMSHVTRDLRPYICTFSNCSRPNHLFGSRQEWFLHEVEHHRREWFCKLCSEAFPSRSGFEQHIDSRHPGLVAVDQRDSLIDRCRRPIERAQSCALCGEELPLLRLRRHLGKHLLQVALFVLP
ncbi:hypothetical protein K440DRAFT_536018, partial [Wilcoxina mikolae CBS 423.85]